MKCPGCEHDSKKTEREASGGACPVCHRKFRLDPPAPLSDYAVEACVARVSEKGKHKFSLEQLACEVERLLVRRSRKNRKVGAFVLFGLGLFVGLMVSVGGRHPLLGGIIGAVLGTIGLVLLLGRPKADPSAKEVVRRYLDAGPPPPLMLTHKPEVSPRRRRDREFDLHSYGFDRVVVVDDPAIVDVLVGNNFHFEHNAAILSMGHYPSHVADLVRKQLAEPGNAKLYLLHDASAEGFAKADDFLKSGFAGKAAVVRLGLWPKTVASVRPRLGPTIAPPAGLSPDVARALATESIPLSALRPAQLMTLLFNGFHQIDSGALVVAPDYDSPILVVYDFG